MNLKSPIFYPVKVSFLIVCFLYIFGIQPATGQSENGVTVALRQLDTSGFPEVSLFVDINDQNHQFVPDLQLTNVLVLEDHQENHPKTFDQVKLGAQFVVAINPAPAFNIRDGLGISRIQPIIDHLDQWAMSEPGTTPDDLSLVTPQGIKPVHTRNPLEWRDQLIQSDIENQIADLGYGILSRAIQVAADKPPQEGMKRAVLLITSPPENEVPSFPDFIELAKQADIRLYVWMISPPGLFVSTGADALNQMAKETGGQLFAFSGTETIPDLGQLLEQLRSTYRLTYDSKLTSSGNHQISVQLTTEEWQATSVNISFDIEIQPPNPIFITPPLIIQKNLPTGNEQNNSQFIPIQTFKLIVEFPDHHPREIKQTALYVNGELMAKRTTPPFDTIDWKMDSGLSNGKVLVQLEVTDVLGLSGKSIQIPIQLEIIRESKKPTSGTLEYSAIITGLGVLLTAGIFFFILIITGKIQPKNQRISRSFREIRKSDLKKISKKYFHIAGSKVSMFHVKQRESKPNKPFAFLEPIAESEDPGTKSRLFLSRQLTKIGRDDATVDIMVNDPSVSLLHAVIRKETQGIMILDEHSAAGTWIHYKEVPDGGILLSHGDVIHIGKVGFRFYFVEAPPAAYPRIQPEVAWSE